MLLPAAFLLVAGLSATAGPATFFTDVTAQAGIPPLRYSEGVNFTDLDGDRLPDLLLPVVKGPLRLFRNLGAGKFADVTAGRRLTAGNGIGAVAGDFDGDGRMDLYLARGAYPYATSVIYQQQSDGTFADISQRSGAVDTGNHITAVLGDFDLDGKPDLFAVNWGLNRLYRNETGGDGARFRDVTAEAGFSEEGKSWGAVVGDFNQDGWPDLAVARGTRGKEEPCRLYLNEGRGRFVDRTAGTGIEKMIWSMGVTAADFDGDGRLDLFFTGFEGPGRLFLNQGGGAFRDATADSGIRAERCMGAAAGDIDGDLLPDLVTAGYSGPVRLFLNLGGGKFREATREAGFTADDGNEGVALADMDGDGDLDLYVANYKGNNRLYRNDTAALPWLKVRPLAGKRPALGATARLFRAGSNGGPGLLLALQELQAGSGFCSQGPSELIFRSRDPGPWDLSVTFPGGKVVWLRGVGPGAVDVVQPAAGE